MAEVESETTRIVVEKKEQWDRVKGNIEAWAEKAVQARLSMLDAEDPAAKNHELKREVRIRVQNILSQAFGLTTKNLLVNGIDYENWETEATTEQFNESLDRNINALRLEQVEMSSIVAERRRKAPDQAKSLQDTLEMMKEAMEWDIEVDANGRPRAVGDEGGVVLNPERLPPRHEETIETYKKTLTNLNEVLSNAPEQIARAERAKAVRETVMSLSK